MKADNKINLQDGIDTAQEIINELKIRMKWISISDELPKKEGYYLVISWPDKDYTPYSSFYIPSTSTWYFAGLTKTPTHWMPLLEPPTQ